MSKAKEEKKEKKESTITLTQIVSSTGLSTGLIAQAVKEGYVSKHGKGTYTISALVGLIRFLNARQNKLPDYDSVEMCAAATGIPKAVIKMEKRTTPEAFFGSRVSLAKLLKGMFAKNDSVNWRDLKDKWSAIREQLAGEREQGLTLDKEEVGRAIAKGISSLFWAYDREAQVTLPADLKGCDEVTIRLRLVETGEKLKALLLAEWGKLSRNGDGK